MRKLKLGAVLVGTIIIFLACSKEKDYNCVCDLKSGGVTYATETHVIKAESSDAAGFACTAYEHGSTECGIR